MMMKQGTSTESEVENIADVVECVDDSAAFITAANALVSFIQSCCFPQDANKIKKKIRTNYRAAHKNDHGFG